MKRMEILLVAAMAIGMVPVALAVPVPAQIWDSARQDPLEDLPGWHELGIGFPADEAIFATDVPDLYIPCPADYEGGQNYRITIQNLSPNHWTDLHYVADPQTTFSNDDGEAQDLTVPGWTLAFRIDSVGLNQPLVFESMTQDNIFEPGEVWEFVVQDYNNTLGLAPSLLDSWDGFGQGRISYASDGGPPSSASIIAIPEPSTLAFMGVAGAIALFIRRLKIC
ncbi:hypothetical protein PDESU_03943 [Pontiella desulfatans]|uniref:Ice-binding protein C-terminal domain-containing protein n=1 Tax=Pontiella desulfatans TaxID=2750659 RepID=A0A6C2U5S4_PONDE|nr:PEP-CTERM sorting domain-containing protein [Pontiella desulfatans]VGO15360.1 hypothetical protein PDESU_03943 [Pontiella desulfatans]